MLATGLVVQELFVGFVGLWCLSFFYVCKCFHFLFLVILFVWDFFSIHLELGIVVLGLASFVCLLSLVFRECVRFMLFICRVIFL